MSPDTSRLSHAAPPALEIEDLSVSYGGMRALSGLSLTVPPGAVVALLGANGAGKSTTLRAISGLVHPDRGRIRVNGVRVDRRPAYAIARLGVVHVPEGRGIFPSLTVQENLEMCIYAVGEDVDPVSGASALFPALGTRLKQLAGSLSGGEQQMLSLARALLSKPKLLMVDEISMGLAPIIVQQLFDALRERAAAGTSLLLVEQYIDAALELADYVYVMEKGRVVDVGQPEDVRHGGLVSAYLGG
ncbi:MAG TPA: ABC transporter ATP-binding protein [Acidimicrobiales bacterium]|nr:ABC transporter ATP-binding protein [Acidimicrobiales bacterium]